MVTVTIQQQIFCQYGNWLSTVPKQIFLIRREGLVSMVVRGERRQQLVGLDNTSHGRGALMTFFFILVQIKDLNIESVVTKESSFYYCLNWINLFESGTVSVSVTGSEMTDSELSLLAVVSRCWSMDSMIGSVCTQNVKWETHLKGWSLLLFTL